MESLNEIITRRLSDKPRLKRQIAIVAKLISETNNSRVKVTFKKDNDEKYEFVLPNRSKDILAEGDPVWIHYWNTITDGYVAIKIGLSTFHHAMGVIVRPMHCKTKIGTTYSFYKQNSTSSTTYSYSVSPSIIQYSAPLLELKHIAIRTMTVYDVWENPTTITISESEINGYYVTSGFPEPGYHPGRNDLDATYEQMIFRVITDNNGIKYRKYAIDRIYNTEEDESYIVFQVTQYNSYSDATAGLNGTVIHREVLQTITPDTTHINTYALAMGCVASADYDGIYDVYTFIGGLTAIILGDNGWHSIISNPPFHSSTIIINSDTVSLSYTQNEPHQSAQTT